MELFPYQVEGVEFLRSRQYALLGDTMGLGKTVQALSAIEGKTMVVCPNSLKYNWAREAAIWQPDMKVSVLDGKFFRLPLDNEIVIVSYTSLPKSLLLPGEIPHWFRFRMQDVTLICDEAHRARGPNTDTHFKVCHLGSVAGRVWFLTGTPILNKPKDLKGLAPAGQVFNYVFESESHFKYLFGVVERISGDVYSTASPEVRKCLNKWMLRRTRSEVMPDLPKKVHTCRIASNLNPKIMELMDIYWAKYEDFIRAQEFNQSYEVQLPEFQEFAKIRSLLARAKKPEVEEIVSEYEGEGEPLLVFSMHLAPITGLASRRGWKLITGNVCPKARQKIVNEFQSGKLRGLGMTIPSGGLGLTLTRASHVLFADLAWTPSLNWQAEDRVCRIGQQASSINITHLNADHSMDVHVNKLIKNKVSMIEAAMQESSQEV